VVKQFIRPFTLESSSLVVVLANLLEAVTYDKVKILPAFISWWMVQDVNLQLCVEHSGHVTDEEHALVPF
jgi:hypothetical protein